MPTLRQLSYLVALARELHFRRAAESVHVTQPTLSAQIKQLEERLGTALVERGGARVALTPMGRELARRARRILAEVEDLEATARSSPYGFAGTLRLGVPPTLGAYLLPHVVPRLHTAYPGMKLYVREGRPAALQDALAQGTYDAVVSPLPVAQGDVEVLTLFREPLRVAVAPDHALAGERRVKRSALKGHDVLALEPGHHLHEQVARMCDDHGARLLRDYEGTSLDTLRLMAGMGVGAAILPALYVRSEIADRGELAVLDLEPAPYRQIALVWRRRSVHAPLLQELGRLVRAVAGSDLPEVHVVAAETREPTVRTTR